jgi:hypothetical protein
VKGMVRNKFEKEGAGRAIAAASAVRSGEVSRSRTNDGK